MLYCHQVIVIHVRIIRCHNRNHSNQYGGNEEAMDLPEQPCYRT